MPVALDPIWERALIDSGLLPECAPVEVRVPDPSVSTVETPAPPAGFIPPPWWARFGFAMRHKRGAILQGPRGTGKTSAMHHLARLTGASLTTFQAAAGCTVDDLTGFRDLKDGSTVFTPGPLPEALERDGWLLIEEANVMHPGVFSRLNTLLDGSGDRLRLPDGRTLPAGPGFRVCLAFNPGYSGTREINPALLDRLVPIWADYLPECDEARVLTGRTGCDVDSALRLSALAAKVRAANLGFDLSPRALFDALDLVRHCGESWTEALDHAVLDRVGDPITRKPQRDAVSHILDLDDPANWPAPAFGVSTVETPDQDGGDE